MRFDKDNIRKYVEDEREVSRFMNALNRVVPSITKQKRVNQNFRGERNVDAIVMVLTFDIDEAIEIFGNLKKSTKPKLREERLQILKKIKNDLIKNI